MCTLNFKKLLLLPLTTAILIFLTSCGQTNAEPNNTKKNETGSINIIVSAAASLRDAMEEIKAAYEKEKADVTVTYNFSASGSLQQQIEQGAEVDVFISAAAKQMNALKDKGLIIEDTKRDLLGNELVLVVPEDSTSVKELKDLTNEKISKIALGEPKSVPAGQYAEEVLTKLNLSNVLKSKVVYAKDVKEVLTWVETGNADAGMVYETDAIASQKVKIAAVASEDSHKPIVYPAAVMKGSENEGAAMEFINYLYSEKAKPVFEKYGFSFIAK